MPAPSLRDIARSIGLSHTTVSEALRNSPRVNEETRRRVLKAARAVGYRPNPLAGALMSEIRRSRLGTFRGVIAVIDIDGPEGQPVNVVRYQRELVKGACERADELGFKAEPFIFGHRNLTQARLDSILQSRGIRGLFLLPASDSPELAGLDWSHYAGIYADYVIERPALHCVCPDHYRSMMMVLDRLHGLGYRRPGLVLNRHHDERLLYRWEAAFQIYQGHHGTFARLAPLIVPEITPAAFKPWFRSARPDVVLCHRAEVVPWMTECGAKVPATHGYCCLNVRMNEVPCAGIDLQPRLIGARGIELLIGQIHHNEYGPPETPSITTIPARWIDGPTLPARPAARRN